MNGRNLEHKRKLAQNTPLLSVCVPTYNRAEFLRVMLQALLPQTQECTPEVEVWVLDNASTDGTEKVIEESRALGPFKVYRQSTNLGPTRNIIDGPSRLAQGTYSWILGDHNLLRPNALKKILQILKNHPDIRIFYARFRCAVYPDHWPAEAVGGFDGTFEYLSHGPAVDEMLANWHEVLHPASSIGTQCYAHITHTEIWRNYWKGRKLRPDYTDALTTYPHTTMLFDTILTDRSYIIACPAITIFNGAQSWSDLALQQKVYFRGLPDLMRLLQAKRKLSRVRLRQFFIGYTKPNCERVMKMSLEYAGIGRTIRDHGSSLLKNRFLISITSVLVIQHLAPVFFEFIQDRLNRARNPTTWWVCNCRPVRWLKAVKQKKID